MVSSLTLNIDKLDKTIHTGHLKMGGSDRQGNRLDLTNYYLTLNGKPFFVTSGEFHYSRYPEAYWEEELLKIKTGGINTVASYVFWGFHEEERGVFEWEGQKSLRRFVELCAKHDLWISLRIGPFVHGEWRNGGLPDWLYGQPFEVRSNAPGYLACVERYYAEVGRQVDGLLFKDGGPIIAIQIENEYMHAGSPWEIVDPMRDGEWVPLGNEGVDHLKALKALAHRAGLDAPIYLLTAWGSPIIEEETLPVYGGYAYPVWVEEPQPSPYYLFRDGHAKPIEGPTHYVPEHYPLVYAEMQGGMQIRYRNRPVVPPESVEAMALVAIGSGSNWLGYYMYHGGTTPVGRHGFNHERLHPQLSYDYQAPLGEFGGRRASYHHLRLIHLFLDAYGEALCPMGTILPDNARAIEPGDVSAVRYCVRVQDGMGFLFINNFQDHAEMRDREDVALEIRTSDGLVRIPETGGLPIKRDVCFLLPINQPLGDARLVYATAQPLTILQYGEVLHYFYFAPDGLQVEFCFRESTVKNIDGGVEQHAVEGRVYTRPHIGQGHSLDVETASGQQVKITTLTRREAEHTWKGTAWDAERVIVSTADLLFTNGGIALYSTRAPEMSMTIWPPLDEAVAAADGHVEQANDHDRTAMQVSVPAKTVNVQVKPISTCKYQLTLSDDALDGLSDLFLEITYEGDTGMAFIDGQLVADNFYDGRPWSIGLKRFAPDVLKKGLCLVFHPLRKGVVKNSSSQLAGRCEFEGQEMLVVHSIVAVPEYSARLGRI
ncbi:MAG: beta-galactosidase [Anaerolineae bacterium]|nr:beta-galactosidase [Anaerolineae bacterium]